VRALIAETGVPGMSIVQFADQDVRNEFTPNRGSVVYTGMHDTETLVGWCARSFADGDAEKAVELARDIERRTIGVENDVVIMPLQDVLLLGNEARMNVPGAAEGNWTWQANAADVEAATSWLRELADESGRAVEER
jgi:4-alpha-glucanotransferase